MHEMHHFFQTQEQQSKHHWKKFLRLILEDLYQVKNWLSQTEWCNSPEDLKREHEEVVSYLLNLDLISTNESNDWSKKLFL